MGRKGANGREWERIGANGSKLEQRALKGSELKRIAIHKYFISVTKYSKLWLMTVE